MQARAQVLSMVMVSFIGLTSFAHADSATFLRGDLDGDGEVTLRDIQHAVDYWYGQQTVEVIEATDTNDDGCFNSLDVAVMIDQVFFDVGRSPVAERVIFTRGDVDADGSVGASDLIALISYLRGDCSPHEILDTMDLDEDGRITANDAAELAEEIGLEQPLLEGSGSSQPAAGASREPVRSTSPSRKGASPAPRR